MREYALILNNAEYDWIYRHIPEKQTAECASILNVSDTVHSIGSQYKLLSSYRDGKTYSETVKHLRWRVSQTEWCLSAGAQPEVFQGKGKGEVCGTRARR